MTAAAMSTTERVLWWVLAAAAVAASVLLLSLVAMRIGYPYELEWMEGAMVDEAARVRLGLDIYSAPSVDHVPFLYTPLLYYLAALAMTVCGEGFVAVRLVSVLATAACAALIFDWVRRETDQRRAGLVAVGIFCAGYGWLRTWYDLGRCDMLFLAAMLATGELLRFGRHRAAWIAGVAVTMAFLAKQSALFWLPFVAAMALLLEWRKAVTFCGSAAACLGVTILGYHLATDGWFTFFVFTMPRQHGVTADRWIGFWSQDIVPIAPLLLAVAAAVLARWRAGQVRLALALAVFCIGGVATSYASRLHAGGFDNVLLYGFGAACCVGPAAIASIPSPRARLAMLLLLAVQFVFLTGDARAIYSPRPRLLYDPRAALPRPEHRQGTEEFLAYLRAQPGQVWVLFHGHLAALAGKGAAAHAQALGDLVTYASKAAPEDRAAAAMAASVEQALGGARFSAIVLEQPYGQVFEQVFARYLGTYRRHVGDLVTSPTALWPLVGMETHSPYALVPRP